MIKKWLASLKAVKPAFTRTLASLLRWVIYKNWSRTEHCRRWICFLLRWNLLTPESDNGRWRRRRPDEDEEMDERTTRMVNIFNSLINLTLCTRKELLLRRDSWRFFSTSSTTTTKFQSSSSYQEIQKGGRKRNGVYLLQYWERSNRGETDFFRQFDLVLHHHQARKANYYRMKCN